MPERTLALSIRGPIRQALPFTLLLLVFAGGCKTSDDAKAAADQMTATAKALQAYYAGLDDVLHRTDRLYVLEEGILGLEYGKAARAQTADTIAELGKREEMGEELAELAGSFTKLASPDAVTAAVASATALQTELDSIKSLGSATTGIDAASSAAHLLLTALQEHKEREAAKQMSNVVASLDAFFAKELPAYESFEDQYLHEAGDFAATLVHDGDVDEAYLLWEPLTEFDLAPGLGSTEIRKKLDTLALAQITSRLAERRDAFKDASTGMEKSLAEMSRRIDLVAQDRAMPLRRAPETLKAVDHWTKAAPGHEKD